MSARRATATWLFAALALVAGAAPAWAQTGKATATEHLVRGSRLYEQGRYDEAIAELKAGYAIDARPDFFYALGQAERKRGDCKAAIGWYQRYVDSGPSTQRTVATLVQIDRCKQELASATPVTPPPRPPVEAPPPQAVTPPPPPPPAAPPTVSEPPPPATAAPVAEAAPPRDSTPPRTTPIYKRWWLWTIVAVVVVGGVGAGVAVALTQRSTFNSTLPDLTWGQSALGVRF
ncbi:MAG: tetratricopeptide repeat protein [Polyangia bacterium]